MFFFLFFIVLGFLVSACSLITICPPVESSESMETCPTSAPDPISTVKPSIVGTWEVIKGYYTITFQFQADGVFIFAMYGNEVARGQYAVLKTIEPKGLIIDYDDGEVIYPIFSFLDSNTIKVENSLPGEPRPIEFYDFLIMTKFIP